MPKMTADAFNTIYDWASDNEIYVSGRWYVVTDVRCEVDDSSGDGVYVRLVVIDLLGAKDGHYCHPSDLVRVRSTNAMTMIDLMLDSPANLLWRLRKLYWSLVLTSQDKLLPLTPIFTVKRLVRRAFRGITVTYCDPYLFAHVSLVMDQWGIRAGDGCCVLCSTHSTDGCECGGLPLLKAGLAELRRQRCAAFDARQSNDGVPF